MLWTKIVAKAADKSNMVSPVTRSQDSFGEDMIIFLTSLTVASVKEASREFTCGASTCTGFKYDLEKQTGSD